MEKKRNAFVLYIYQNGKQEFIGISNDYSWADFSYCADDKTNVQLTEKSNTLKIIISCSSHKNSHKQTRGKVEIGLVNGNLNSVKIDGEVKSWLRWKKDSKFNCTNLIQQ